MPWRQITQKLWSRIERMNVILIFLGNFVTLLEKALNKQKVEMGFHFVHENVL